MSDIKQKTIDPETLRALISTQTKVDLERIDIRHLDGRLRVGIAGLTEPEQRAINGGIRGEGFAEDAFEVAEDEAPGKVKHYDLEKLTRLLAGMWDAPDGHLDKTYARRCAAFAKEEHGLEETLEFIRNTRDLCVFSAGASSFMMQMWSFMLKDYPEPDEVKKVRRAKLDALVGM